jgi:hypothetical protein
MMTGTMHMGGSAAGVARPDAGCSLHPTYVGTVLPSIAFPWHATNDKQVQVSPVFLITDRPTRRPSERFP